MRPDDYARYSRLHEACLAMANQSIVADERARWLAMAETWLKRATELSRHTRSQTSDRGQQPAP
jgi:hypothetical protein